MKRRITALFLALVLMVTLLPVSAFAASSNNGRMTAGDLRRRDKILAMKEEYPEGMRWTNDDYYEWNTNIYTGGFGCAAFAYMMSDVAYGQWIRAELLTDFTYDMLRVGDALRINNDTHYVVVVEIYDDYIIVAEGNYNKSIHWGRKISRSDVMKADYLLTRVAIDPEELSSWAVEEATMAVEFGLVPFDMLNNCHAKITRLDFCRLMIKTLEAMTGMWISNLLWSMDIEITAEFTDTDDYSVLAAHALGIVSGRSEDRFDPYGSITRQEAAAMIARMLKLFSVREDEGIEYVDSDEFAPWAVESIAFVSRLTDIETGNRVMTGTGEGKFSPKGTFTREQAMITAKRVVYAALWN